MLNTTAWASSPLLRDRARIRPAVIAAFMGAMALVGFIVVSVPVIQSDVQLERAGMVQQRSQLLAKHQVAKATKQILASNPHLARVFKAAHHDKHVRHALKAQLTMLCDEGRSHPEYWALKTELDKVDGGEDDSDVLSEFTGSQGPIDDFINDQDFSADDSVGVDDDALTMMDNDASLADADADDNWDRLTDGDISDS